MLDAEGAAAGPRGLILSQGPKYVSPRHPIGAEAVRMKLLNAGTAVRATLRRIDEDHANTKRRCKNWTLRNISARCRRL
jgi:hypothetical protein